MDPVPALDLTTSGSGPDHEFYRVTDAAILSSGVIAVAEWDSNEIRLYSPEGRFLSRAGGDGEGPGEFRRLFRLQPLPGDSLAAFDSRLVRLTVLAPRGEVARVISLSPLLLSALDLLEDGSLVGLISWPSLELFEGNREVLHRQPVGVLRLSASGEVMDTIAVAAGHDEFIFEQGSARSLFIKDSHIVVHGGEIFLGDSDRMEVSVFDPSGRLTRIFRVPGLDLSISAEEIAHERAGWLGPNSSQERREIVARIPVPDTKPAYSSLHVDSEGNTWAEEYRQGWWAFTDDVPRRWTVFGPDGKWLGEVNLPPRFTVYRIGRDYILGLARDDLEVEQIRVLRLSKG